jgi:hypothetical protein
MEATIILRRKFLTRISKRPGALIQFMVDANHKDERATKSTLCPEFRATILLTWVTTVTVGLRMAGFESAILLRIDE